MPTPSGRKGGSILRSLTLLIAEIRKNLTVLQQIRTFIETTEKRELAASGKTPATALMLAGIKPCGIWANS